MADQSHREEMNAAIRAHRERHAAPRTIAAGPPAARPPAARVGPCRPAPPVGFALQELLELSLHTGTFGWRASLAPTSLPGLLLQLPFALAAYVAARVLLRTAEHVGRSFAP